MGFRLLILIAAVGVLQSGTAQTPLRDSGEPATSERGKKIFVARCAKCHDDDMKKKLPDGSSLFARLMSSKDPKSRLGTRLKDSQERDAVASYFFELQTPSAGK